MNSTIWITITLAILVTGGNRGSVACPANDIEYLEGLWGQNVTIVCRTGCPSLYWYFEEKSLAHLRSCNTNDRLCKTNDNDTHILHIVNTSELDRGVYGCKCYENGYFKEYVACYDLRISCQAQIQINGEPSQLHNSTAAAFTTHTLNVTINDRVKVNCFQGATEETNCNGVKRAHGFTYSFKIKEKHNLCYIICNTPRGDELGCSVNVTLYVAMLETTIHTANVSTHSSTVSTKISIASDQFSANITPCVTKTTTELGTNEEEKLFVRDKPGSFPWIVLLGIVIVILVAVSFVVCFFIFFSRLKSKSRPKNKLKTVNLSADDNTQVSTVYATVIESSKECTAEENDTMERGLASNSELYYELNGVEGKESTALPSLTQRAETSVTIGSIPKANPSNAKTECREYKNEGANNLYYSEVSKEEKQALETENTSSPPTSICEFGATNFEAYQVINKSRSSNDQNVVKFFTSEIVYTVVERKKNEAN